MTKLNQSGSHIIAIAVVLLVLGVIGFAGYKVAQPASSGSSKSSTVSDVAVPDTLKTKADLSQAAKSLDSSSSDINSSVDASSLDDDLDDLL